MNTLLLFAKDPVAGSVKTRLSPPYRPEEAASLYRAFVEDMVGALGSLRSVRKVLTCDPDADRPFFRDLAKRHGWDRAVQAKGDLGKRLVSAFEMAFGEGAVRAAALGSDSPTLDPGLVSEAFRLLERADAVFGPTLDGGYYLVGLRRESAKPEELFRGVRWSSPTTLLDTLGRARVLGLETRLLPFWYDVDSAGDICLLRMHLEILEREAEEVASHTRAVLSGLGEPGGAKRIP